MFAGLRDAYQLTGNEKAKAVLIHLSDWAIAVTSKLDDAGFQSMLEQEHGGMREVPLRCVCHDPATKNISRWQDVFTIRR